MRLAQRLGALAAASVVAACLAGTAAATPSETPIGFVGACNMVASFAGAGPSQGVGVQDGGGMYQAMFGTPAASASGKENGNAGMATAVAQSGGQC